MLKLSDEAIGAVMLALQNSLMEQSDIVPVLKGFDLKISDKKELFIMNPPLVKVNDISEQSFEDYPVDNASE